MSQPVVVGLLGRAGSGKSTAAGHLERAFHARLHSFARPLKELAKELFQLSDEQVYGTQAQKETVDPRWGVTPRELLIRLGEGARKHIGDRVWADGCLTEILTQHAQGGPLLHVVEDVRHINEAAMIKSDPRIRGFVVKLEYADRASSSAYNSAPSEVSVDQVPVELIDYVVSHEKTPDALDLQNKLFLAVQELVGPIALPI